MFDRVTRCLTRIFCCCIPQAKNEVVQPPPDVRPKQETVTPITLPPVSEVKASDTVAEVKIQPIPYQDIKQKKARVVSNYTDNITAALQLFHPRGKLDSISQDHSALLEISKEQIKEHAARRVDLYFYLLIAVYNSKVDIKQGDTILQHGKGRKTADKKGLTHACHSSLFPTVISSEDTDEFTTVLLLTRHFMDSLNSTVELPLFANQFDSELEGKISTPSLFRQKSMEILCKVSGGSMNPIAGMHAFFREMDDTFDALSSAKRIKKGSIPYLSRMTGSVPKPIKVKLIELVKDGVYCKDGQYDREHIVDAYIQLLLRLKPEEIAVCKSNAKDKDRIYLEKIYQIRNEIYTSKSHFKSIANG